MSGQSNSLATRGVICKSGNIIRITKCVLPFNLKLVKTSFPLNLSLNTNNELNLKIKETKLNMRKIPYLRLNKSLPVPFKLNLRKCEE